MPEIQHQDHRQCQARLKITDKGRAWILSAYEWDVLKELAMGSTTAQAGANLGVTDKTVQYHRAHLYRKTGCRSEVDLCRFAIRLGLIEP